MRRIPGGPSRAAAQVRSAADARADGRTAARVLRSAGVNMDLAPVADVARAGSALEREMRSYGRSPARVASLATAFAAGLRAGGVRATAKHFPGFGAATVNTDDAPATVSASQATLRAVDERPFAALIKGGVDVVMLSTAVYPARRRAAGRVLAALDRRRAARAPAISAASRSPTISAPRPWPRSARTRSAPCAPSRPASTCRCSPRATATARAPPRACSPPPAAATSPRRAAHPGAARARAARQAPALTVSACSSQPAAARHDALVGSISSR